jgi:hypothetical protein
MTGPLSSQFRDAYDASKLNVAGVWIRYFALGGEASEMEVDAYLNGAIALPAFQHDMLAHAINERLDEIAPCALQRGLHAGRLHRGIPVGWRGR